MMESPSFKKYFIGGLSWTTTEDGVKQFFEKLGFVVEKAQIMRNKSSGRSRGFGFVILHSPGAPPLSQYELDGRQIEVKCAVPKEEMGAKTKKIFVGGLPVQLNQSMFQQHFSRYGPIVEAQIMKDRKNSRSRGFGFIRFQSEESVELVLADEHLILGKQVEVKKALPKHALEANQDGDSDPDGSEFESQMAHLSMNDSNYGGHSTSPLDNGVFSPFPPYAGVQPYQHQHQHQQQHQHQHQHQQQGFGSGYASVVGGGGDNLTEYFPPVAPNPHQRDYFFGYSPQDFGSSYAPVGPQPPMQAFLGNGFYSPQPLSHPTPTPKRIPTLLVHGIDPSTPGPSSYHVQDGHSFMSRGDPAVNAAFSGRDSSSSDSHPGISHKKFNNTSPDLRIVPPDVPFDNPHDSGSRTLTPEPQMSIAPGTPPSKRPTRSGSDPSLGSRPGFPGPKTSKPLAVLSRSDGNYLDPPSVTKAKQADISSNLGRSSPPLFAGDDEFDSEPQPPPERYPSPCRTPPPSHTSQPQSSSPARKESLQFDSGSLFSSSVEALFPLAKARSVGAEREVGVLSFDLRSDKKANSRFRGVPGNFSQTS